MSCLECKEGYYLENSSNTCRKRQNRDNFCQIYSPNTDQCLKCDKGYYVSLGGDKCNIYPQGIIGCGKYLSKNVC